MNPFRKSTSALSGLFVLTLTFFATGCDLLGSDEENEAVTPGVYVVNQGNFSQGNGSITVYDPATEATATLSPSGGFGSILQSAEFFGDWLYVMANTGQRVDVIDPSTQARVGQIPVSNPRYMAWIGPAKAYVTSQLYDRSSIVTIINPQTGARVDSIEVGGSADGIAVVGDRAFVATGGTGEAASVVMINTTTNVVAQTIGVDCDVPRYVVADAEGDVFVICTGETLFDPETFEIIGHTDGAVRVLNGETGTVMEQIAVDAPLGAAGLGQDASFSSESDEIYVVKDGNRLLRIDTETNEASGELGPFEGGPIGSVGYDAVSGLLYVGHVPSFSESGTVTIHDRSGARVGEFEAGVAPTHITFRHEAP